MAQMEIELAEQAVLGVMTREGCYASEVIKQACREACLRDEDLKPETLRHAIWRLIDAGKIELTEERMLALPRAS